MNAPDQYCMHISACVSIISAFSCHSHGIAHHTCAKSMMFISASVTLVGCDHVVKEEVQLSRDRTVSWLPACGRRPGTWIVVSCDPEYTYCG